MMLRLLSQMCLLLWMLLCSVRLNTITCCHERDRSLLLMFKQGVVDPSNRLSSWSSVQDCCLWEGVECDDDRVVRLMLPSSHNSETLRGEINLSSLLSLDFLEQLHLDYNDFERISMPSINNSVATHTHLLPNSSKIWVLNLSYNIYLRIDNLHFLLSQLPSLTSVRLSGIRLPSETNWVQLLASLPLQKLFLNHCYLNSSVLSRICQF
ncbi:hypothetical protein QN277_018607 [Acacia crassicarpa]|uniref:Leucine-rich repeat-containing N-terminal plant-type domain-containing protein n=1 Tax=Acacia crassicarpa TaxID=499986 RepID=A0AAE1MST1_9FABA|nr:hypothetical protein QN277_018607 [Acacia crassicarpa]